MSIEKKNRTELENNLEIEAVKEFFNFEAYPLVYTIDEHGYGFVDNGRDGISIRMVHNRKRRGFYVYGRRKTFRQPIREEYEVFLKGSIFIVYNKITKNLTVYNMEDNTIISERLANHVNLRMEMERVIKDLKEKMII